MYLTINKVAKLFSLMLGFFFLPLTHADEKDALALVIQQLEQIQSTLQRAQIADKQNSQNTRFYFDYKKASEELILIQHGIKNYLEPVRAQPSESIITGQYRKER